MEERPATLGVHVGIGPDADAEEVAEATAQLRRELLDLDVDAVELPPAGEPPPGTRAVELAALGALLVTVAQSQLLTPVLAAVRSWLAGSPRRSRGCCAIRGSAASRCARCSTRLRTRSAWRWRSSSPTAGPTICCWCIFPATGSRTRPASCTSRPRTPCWAGWARPRWRPSS